MKKEVYVWGDQYRAFVPLFVGSEQCQPDHCYGPAVRNYWLIHFILEGKGTYHVGNKTFSLQPGQAFIIKPDEVTRYHADSKYPWRYVWVAFQSSLPLHLPYILKDPALAEILAPISGTDALSSSAAVAIIWRVIDRLCPTAAPATPKGYVSVAKSLVHKQYMTDLSVSRLADAVGLERSYFSCLFKKETGLSPSRYLLSYRMKKAKQLLLDGYSVSIVAASVGFNDPFTFSRSFKNFFGYSPKKTKK